jgi:hypothetical protein
MGMKKLLSIIFGIGLLAAAHVAVAQTDIDLRLKLGSAAGVDTTEIGGIQGDTSQESSGNFQVEVAFTPRMGGPVNFVGTAGIFARNHKGSIDDLFFPPTDVKYDAAGVSGSAGVSIRANENFHVEARFELDLGSGKPTLDSPVVIWNPVRARGYAATSLIVGGYLTLGRPGLQLGLELGAQSFEGDFQIENNFGFWEDAKVKGSGGTANLVIGYRF